MSSNTAFPPDVIELARTTYERRPITLHGIAAAIMADRATRVAAAGLTNRQAQCLGFIHRYQLANAGISPKYEEIATGLGLSSKSQVGRLIDELEDRGALRRLPGRARAITIIAKPAT